MAFCTKCGKPMTKQFCGACGTAAVTPDVAAYLQSLSTAQPLPPPGVRLATKPIPKQHRRTKMIAMIAIAAVLVIALGILFVSSSSSMAGLERQLLGTWEREVYGWIGSDWEDDMPMLRTGTLRRTFSENGGGIVRTTWHGSPGSEGSSFSWQLDRGRIFMSPSTFENGAEWDEFEITDNQLTIRRGWQEEVYTRVSE